MATHILDPQTKLQATLNYNGGTLELPVVRGSENETALDIQALRNKTGFVTLDPGFGNTGACRSANVHAQVDPVGFVGLSQHAFHSL